MFSTRQLDDRTVEYTFPLAGDVLPSHYHPPGTEHTVECVLGSCDVYGKTWTRSLVAGQTLAAKPGRHEIKATSDNTVTLHRSVGLASANYG